MVSAADYQQLQCLLRKYCCVVNCVLAKSDTQVMSVKRKSVGLDPERRMMSERRALMEPV